jgi:hypothetical protein
VQVDGRWRGVADAGWFCGFLDPVLVVAGSFDCPWAGAFTAVGDKKDSDISQVLGQALRPVLRGECPPSQ